VLSFGPYLIRDGVINEEGVGRFGVTLQPRAGIGMVSRGHYIHIIVESRTSKSGGVNTAWLAERFHLLGCDTAFNLDGGQTAVLIFLGEQLNEIGKYDDKTNARKQNEVMGIGILQEP
jgi:exopolysaccharide biosynthesis protein